MKRKKIFIGTISSCVSLALSACGSS
ncbi:peptidylprolyl isomerase, partial [Bacillus cereus]|nr:peptidylprolyl isomerase [Bacillus cereus]